MAEPGLEPEPGPGAGPNPAEAVLRELALFELRCDGEDVAEKRKGRGEGARGGVLGRFEGVLGSQGGVWGDSGRFWGRRGRVWGRFRGVSVSQRGIWGDLRWSWGDLEWEWVPRQVFGVIWGHRKGFGASEGELGLFGVVLGSLAGVWGNLCGFSITGRDLG